MVAGGLDHDTLLRLLLRNRGMLVGYITSIVRDPHLAEDVFQAVSLITVKKIGALEDEAQFPAWVRKIARLESLNAARKQRNAPQPLDEAVLDALEPAWNAADEEPEAQDALRRCVEKLTPRNRRLVELRYRDGVAGRKLAETLSQPLNTVYVALARIHRTLAECVKLAMKPEA
jgi:RNA polymerase sigma-70 factor (ECF subfamily)